MTKVGPPRSCCLTCHLHGEEEETRPGFLECIKPEVQSKPFQLPYAGSLEVPFLFLHPEFRGGVNWRASWLGTESAALWSVCKSDSQGWSAGLLLTDVKTTPLGCDPTMHPYLGVVPMGHTVQLTFD